MTRLSDVEWVVVHCSATNPDQDIGEDEIRQMHLAKGWDDIGYHVVVRRNGAKEYGRPFDVRGAHVKGYNSHSLGICMVGGVSVNGPPENNFTPEQFASVLEVLDALHILFPTAKVKGHRDFFPDLNGDGVIDKNDWLKDCPCFNVRQWLHANFRSGYVG
jgi:N-acetylmuramoyl-L-alanine amidase